MKIVMVASEAVPYAKTGGLADVVPALSRALTGRGHQVTIIMPRYSFIDTASFRELPLVPLISLGFAEYSLRLFTPIDGNGELSVIFLDHPLFSSRDGLYGENGGQPYRDNHIRFALLAKGAIETSRRLNLAPDLFHLHDWQAALVPAYLAEYEKTGVMAEARTIFTIHNIAYQGVFSKQDIHALALTWDSFSDRPAGYRDQINFLRSAIINSDHITTVSPSYAKEIMTEAFGEGLHTLLADHAGSVSGILNGADYKEWDPANDPFLDVSFGADDLSGKALAKKRLQKEADLPVDPSIPIIGMVGRLAEQKGFVELLDEKNGALQRILEGNKVQVVLLGTGASWIESRLLEISESHPNLRVFLTFNEKLAHVIEAGSDFFLMPSRYEPCGLNQIYSLRYGSLPIVTQTGGLADTVIPESQGRNRATGFVFPQCTPDQIVETVRHALDLWEHDRNAIDAMRRRAMRAHFSWEDSAAAYEKLYKRLINRPRR